MHTTPVLIAGAWRQAAESGRFQPTNPSTAAAISRTYPVSDWRDCEAVLEASAHAAVALRSYPAESRARFLELFADAIEASTDALCALAHEETGLPVQPRLRNVELPRTTGQLRTAAKAARDSSWAQAIIDTAANIRSMRGPIGPVAIFGPNNFPLAFNGVAGGDFAAAIAAGNPVIAKAHTAHPGTCHKLASLACQALDRAGLPAAMVQMLFAISREDGYRMVSDQRLGAVAFTGSRRAGLALKQIADKVGTPFYAELSSINPVVILPGALRERGPELAEEFAGSCLMGSGQFCTNPGLIIVPASGDGERFMAHCGELFDHAKPGTLLSLGTEQSLKQAIALLREAGATLVSNASDTIEPKPDKSRFCLPNTLLCVSGQRFLQDSVVFQTEVFGNAALMVVSENHEQTATILRTLEGNLTGSIYSSTTGVDDEAYDGLAPILRERVGRLLNDKMPTGVAVSPAMNHGGPFPASGHPGFTAVGVPTSLIRFSKLDCYDNVRHYRLPPLLQDENPLKTWRSVNGNWTRDPIN
ncbi:aldehyde dehydrogenase (NADP(+)) [Microbulbifer spongiae]|uniref:Aldehyde dehydrogenase (NADP(+)) n=1 Tax=Microbulbifer spongiae TaxID=2944933 RepID=A0ABY9E9V1_9GAMM|nr:aldehyde dehydrogenase (NADP(+)) [Microbulbifer sp. MI-G]WKD48140.1 aldehyde dehydrogenase (NADP(+)) [Microbulbifer sp. MI-G]